MISRNPAIANDRTSLPPYRNNVSCPGKIFRFIDTGAAATAHTYQISSSKLASLVTITTTLNTTVTQIFDAVRLRRVRIWQPALQTATVGAGTGTPASCTVSLNGGSVGTSGDIHSVSDQAIGSAGVAFVEIRPKVNTQAAQWQPAATNAGTSVLLTIQCYNSAIIEVKVDLVTTNVPRSTNNTIAVTSATLTSFNYMALDNAAGGNLSATNALVPDQSLPTAT